MISLAGVHLSSANLDGYPINPATVTLYALSSSLSQIMFVLALIMVGVMFLVGSVASLILGAVGGAVSRIYIKKPKQEKYATVNVCSKCGTQNHEIAKFCSVCGTPLPEKEKPKDKHKRLKRFLRYEAGKGIERDLAGHY